MTKSAQSEREERLYFFILFADVSHAAPLFISSVCSVSVHLLICSFLDFSPRCKRANCGFWNEVTTALRSASMRYCFKCDPWCCAEQIHMQACAWFGSERIQSRRCFFFCTIVCVAYLISLQGRICFSFVSRRKQRWCTVVVLKCKSCLSPHLCMAESLHPNRIQSGLISTWISASIPDKVQLNSLSGVDAFLGGVWSTPTSTVSTDATWRKSFVQRSLHSCAKAHPSICRKTSQGFCASQRQEETQSRNVREEDRALERPRPLGGHRSPQKMLVALPPPRRIRVDTWSWRRTYLISWQVESSNNSNPM